MGAKQWKTLENVFQSTGKTKSTKWKTISELYTDDNKSKYSSNCKGIFKSVKTFSDKLHTQETTFKAVTTEFTSKICNRDRKSNA